MPALSFAGASLASTMLRFHSPLIEPDGRISRIRLSDKNSCFRPREAGAVGAAGGSGPARRAGTRRGSVIVPRPCTLCFRTQPLAEPMADVAVHGSIGLAHRAQAEVVRPTHAACRFSRADHRPRRPASSHRRPVNSLISPAELLDLLRRRSRPDVGPARLRRVAPPDRVTQEVERSPPARDTAASSSRSPSTSASDIMSRIAAIASSAVPRQQITKSSA